MTWAIAESDGWQVEPPAPVGDLSTLLFRLTALADGAPVVLGVDFPLGLPRAYAVRHTVEADFPMFLRGLAARPDFFRVCATLAEVSGARPFYPDRGVAGMTRAAHADALGLSDAAGLCRACDRATAERPAGAPLFWTLGANQSGKAAISAWRDLLLPALTSGAALRLWPFEGDLDELLAPSGIVMAETYPAEAMRHFALRMGGSKRRQADRAALSGAVRSAFNRLNAVQSSAMKLALDSGFGADAAGEDRFDSTLGLLCVLNVLAGNRSGGIPDDPWLRRWEGWVLGQTALPLVYPA